MLLDYINEVFLIKKIFENNLQQLYFVPCAFVSYLFVRWSGKMFLYALKERVGRASLKS